MRASKEERVVRHSETVLAKLEQASGDGVISSEYHKLLNEYKKLQKRYMKTMKHSDTMGHSIMQKNDSLSDNLQYTLKTARTKLMDNITAHRKTKETSDKYMLKLKMLEESYDELYEKNALYEQKLKYYMKTYGDIKEAVYVQKSTKESRKVEINPPFYRNKSIIQALALEAPQQKSEFILIKIGIKDFGKVLDHVEQLTSLNTFLLAIAKFIRSYVNQENQFLFHHKADEFYLLSNKHELDSIQDLIAKLNGKREIMDVKVTFMASMTKFDEAEDNDETILQRCDYAFSKVRNKEQNIIVI